LTSRLRGVEGLDRPEEPAFAWPGRRGAGAEPRDGSAPSRSPFPFRLVPLYLPILPKASRLAPAVGSSGFRAVAGDG